MIYVVDSPLQQFDQQSLARFNQIVSKIGHTLKTVFYNLKSQGPLKNTLTISDGIDIETKAKRSFDSRFVSISNWNEPTYSKTLPERRGTNQFIPKIHRFEVGLTINFTGSKWDEPNYTKT